MTSHEKPNTLARALRRFFAEHLPLVRGLSPHTVLSYRDALALFLRFLATRSARHVIDLDICDLDPDGVIAFLEDLETGRANSAATRNARLAAIHAFARFVAAHHPGHVDACQRLLAVPFKRARTRIVEYLEADEIRALLDATDRSTVEGRRDRTLLLVMFNTGARVQELLDLRPRDLQLVRPLQVRLFGKGRKERLCPLWPRTAETLGAFLAEAGLDAASAEPLFRNRRGEPLTRFGVRYLVRKYAALARAAAPVLARKRVHPHTMRHSAAVHLLQSGVDLVAISHWLGHASVETTNRYAVVDLETKRAALAKAGPVGDDVPTPTAWRSDASILAWLEAL
jgi:site-specific recombinase XerD